MASPATASFTLTLDCVGDDVRISAYDASGHMEPRALGIDRTTLAAFAAAVEKSAWYGQVLPDAIVMQGQTIQKAVLAESIGKVFVAYDKRPLLLKFALSRELQAIPWETLCNPGEALGFWGTSPNVFPVRAVSTLERWTPCAESGAIRVLMIAPTGSAGRTNLRQSLEDRIHTGEIEWLDPIEGPAAKVPGILDRLRRKPFPHVLHFLGHGGINKAGQPCLRMGDDDDEEKWLPTEILAQQLAPSFRSILRLVVLEACEGAKTSTSELTSDAFSSSAQVLAGAGADAVVAYQWPVKADVAQTLSTQFYRALAAVEHGAGDVALALNEARRMLLAKYDGSAVAQNPVLYLRAPESRIFNFKNRRVEPPIATIRASSTTDHIPAPLGRIAHSRFSLVLGDRWKNNDKALDKFRDSLRQGLPMATSRNGLPLSTLAQWFVLHRGAKKIDAEFQKAFRASTQPPIIPLIARTLQPGVHTTLLRTPWLEKSLAEAHPDRSIYVIQPQDGGALVLLREAGADADAWDELDKAPADANLDEVFLILRPYRGYRADDIFTSAVVTEDEYHQWLPPKWLDKVLPMDLTNSLEVTLQDRPALVLGLSIFTANHRMLLQALHPRAIPQRSLAVLHDGEEGEVAMWTSGAGLPGKNAGIEALEMSTDDMLGAFEVLAEEAAG